MRRKQHKKNTTNSNQDNISLLKSNNPTTVSPKKKSNIAEAQDKDFKIVIINILGY